MDDRYEAVLPEIPNNIFVQQIEKKKTNNFNKTFKYCRKIIIKITCVLFTAAILSPAEANSRTT